MYYIVWYGKGSEDQGFSLSDRVQRSTIMTALGLPQSLKLSFQPEAHDYIVTYIAEGINDVWLLMLSVVQYCCTTLDGLPLYKVPLNMKYLTSSDLLMARGYKEENGM